MVRRISDPEEKRAIARKVLEALPDWFGIPEAREGYIKDSAGQLFLAVSIDGEDAGFLCLKETGDATVELAVMGILPGYHRRDLGRALVTAAKAQAAELGYAFLQVKTVQMGRYEIYDDTNRFYLSMGFREFEVFPQLWDAWNPCQVYVMSLK